jgi:hypothetical protein
MVPTMRLRGDGGLAGTRATTRAVRIGFIVIVRGGRLGHDKGGHSAGRKWLHDG